MTEPSRFQKLPMLDVSELEARGLTHREPNADAASPMRDTQPPVVFARIVFDCHGAIIGAEFVDPGEDE